MITLLLTLLLARPAPATSAPPSLCSLRLEELIETVTRMKTRRTIPTHDEVGAPTQALRQVLDEYLHGLFPEDVLVTANEAPLPVFEVKAERKMLNGKTSHLMLLLKMPDGAPAAMTHLEIVDGKEHMMTMPLGEAGIRELREHLLEAYSIPDPLSPKPNQAQLMTRFFDDKLKLDATDPTGLAETDFADVLYIAPTQRLTDEWTLTLRRDSAGISILRTTSNDEHELEVFPADQDEVALNAVVEKVRTRFIEHPDTMDLSFYFGKAQLPALSYYRVGGIWRTTGHALSMPDDALSDELLLRTLSDHVPTEAITHHQEQDGKFITAEIKRGPKASDKGFVRLIKLLTEQIAGRLTSAR